MAFDQGVDPRSKHVAQFLRKNNICLWEPPYWQNNQSNVPEELILSTSQECRLPIEVSEVLLSDLQKHALERVEERQLLSEQGVATIKLRMQQKQYSLKLPESALVSDLYVKVAEVTEIPKNRIKLIHNGVKLDDQQVPLADKKIKSNTKIVGLVTSARIEQFIKEELDLLDMVRQTNEAKSDARTLSALDQCEITNQFGAKVGIPEKIKLDLTAALSLHEKGRFEMRRGKAEEALNYLLEAERILQNIDAAKYPFLEQLSNMALLNLDVAWCFLEVGSLSHLADGDRRILLAQQGLTKAYGPNMERVKEAKGSAANEETLYVRLKLLQGVSAFYRANYGEARQRLREADALITKLTVDQDSLVTLMSLGYTAKECRLALRQTRNNVELALIYLEEKKGIREKDHERWRLEQQGKYLQGINKTSYERMINDVGVTPAAARKALLKYGDDYNKAVHWAMEYECASNRREQERKSRSQEPIAENTAGPSSAESLKTAISESDIAALNDMGVERNAAKELLGFFEGSLTDAENYLLTGEAKDFTQMDAMLDKMRSFVSNESEDYLDSTLEKETECLALFKARLNGIESFPNNEL